jgi:hypothetical protein
VVPVEYANIGAGEPNEMLTDPDQLHVQSSTTSV